MTVIDSEQTDLQAQVDALTIELERLRAFVDNVFDLTLNRHNGNALSLCQTLHVMARDERGVKMCDSGCEKEHPVSEWKAMLGVPHTTLYRWMNQGLEYRPEPDGMKTKRYITHEAMRRFRARN